MYDADMIKHLWYLMLRLTKKKAGLVLTSGKEIIIYCDTFKWKTENNKIVSYEFEGMVRPILSHVRLDEIIAVVTYRDALIPLKPKK
jgi:hypothetical protein